MVMRARGINNTALQAIFRSTAIAKLLYAARGWSGFIKMPDRPRVDAFLYRSKKCGHCPPNLTTVDEKCDSVDQKMFDNIPANQDHLLSIVLPPPAIASQNSNRRPRPHSQEQPQLTGYLTDSNFITRILYKKSY
jgi:hypothetical protein